jgi:hypothetical protein
MMWQEASVAKFDLMLSGKVEKQAFFFIYSEAPFSIPIFQTGTSRK